MLCQEKLFLTQKWEIVERMENNKQLFSKLCHINHSSALSVDWIGSASFTLIEIVCIVCNSILLNAIIYDFASFFFLIFSQLQLEQCLPKYLRSWVGMAFLCLKLWVWFILRCIGIVLQAITNCPISTMNNVLALVLIVSTHSSL